MYNDKIFPKVLPIKAKDMIAGLSGTHDGEHYVLPRFQRRSVWSRKDNQELINSMRKGWPIGSIMLAYNDKENDKDYLIIDGQQRIRAIQDCIKNPFEYYDFEKIGKIVWQVLEKNDELDDSIKLNKDEDNIESIIQILKRRFRSNFEGIMPGEYVTEILDANNFTKTRRSLILSRAFNKELGQELLDQKINLYEIPIIRYLGDQNLLPDIFEVVNRKGTKLNKYDILKARWDGIRFKINDSVIMTKLKESYSEANENIEIHDFDIRTFSRSKINLAEYLIGLGQKIGSMPLRRLFGKSIDDIGFKLFLSIAKKQLQKTSEIKDFFIDNNLHKDSEKLSKLQSKIESTIDFVDSILERILDFNFNKKRINNQKVSFSQVQMMTIIGSVFNSKYNIDETFSEKGDWQISEAKYKKNLSLHFIKDIIQDSWNTKHPEDLGKKRIDNNYYLSDIEKKEWDVAFSIYYEKSLEKSLIPTNVKKRKFYDPTDLLFLTFLYVKQMVIQSEVYEIEHVIPYKRLTDMAEELSIGSMALNSVGNLALISKTINAKKSKNTFKEFESTDIFREFYVGLPNTRLYDHDKENLIYGYDVEIPKNSDGNDSFDNVWYEKFLTERFRALKDLFYKNYGIN